MLLLLLLLGERYNISNLDDPLYGTLPRSARERRNSRRLAAAGLFARMFYGGLYAAIDETTPGVELRLNCLLYWHFYLADCALRDSPFSLV